MSLLSKNETVKELNNNCRYQTIYDILAYYHIPITMNQVILLASDYYVNAILMNDVNKINFMGLTMFSPLFDINKLKTFGFTYKKLQDQETDSIEKVIDFAKESKIVVYYFDSAEMTGKYTDSFVNINLLTTGIVLDGDVQKEKLIFNSLANTKKKYNDINYSQFEKARNKTIYPFSPEKAAFLIEHIESVEKYDIEHMILLGLKNLSKNYFNTMKPKVYTEHTTIWSGCKAYEICEKYFIGINTMICSNKVADPQIIDKIFIIIMKAFRRTLTCSTATFNRMEFGSALLVFAKERKEDHLLFIAKKIINTSKIWRNIVRKAYSADKFLLNKSDYIINLIQDINILKELETEIMDDFARIRV